MERQPELTEVERYREKDKGHLQQTLHPDRLRSYLRENKLGVDNFDEKFTMATAMDIAQKGDAPGDKEMYSDLSKATQFAKDRKLKINWEESNATTFASGVREQIKNLFPNNEHERMKHESMMMHAYRVYHEVRKIAQRSLELRKEFKDLREGEKSDIEGSIIDSLKSGLGGFLGKLSKNLDTMTTGEKFWAGGAVIGIGALFCLSQNKSISWVREKALTVLKYGGGGVIGATALNYLFKAFTGTSGLQYASNELRDWNATTAGNPETWKNHFDTDEEGAENLQKTVIALGDMDFFKLAAKYEAAKGERLELGSRRNKRISPENAYKALQTFFKKHPIDELKAQYPPAKQPPTFLEVVTDQLAQSGDLEPRQNVAEAAAEAGESAYVATGDQYEKHPWIWTLGGPAAGYAHWLYEANFGHKGTEAEVKKYAEERLQDFMKEPVQDDAGIAAFLDRKFDANSPSAKNYKEVLLKPFEPDFPTIKSLEVKNDSMYVVNQINLQGQSPSNKDKILTDATIKVYDFLKAKYPNEGDNVVKMTVPTAGVSVMNPPKFIQFFRLPLPGSPEYISHFSGAPQTRKEEPGIEPFNEKTEFTYDKLQPHEKEQLRLQFLLRSPDQNDQLQAVCGWFKTIHQGKAEKTKADVVKALLTDNTERDRAIAELGLKNKQNLAPNKPTLDMSKEAELATIETNASETLDKSWYSSLYPPNWFASENDIYTILKEQMKMNWGNKVRLAILGDTEALEYFADIDRKEYGPENNKRISNIIEKYKDMCEKLVEMYKDGRLKMQKTS